MIISKKGELFVENNNYFLKCFIFAKVYFFSKVYINPQSSSKHTQENIYQLLVKHKTKFIKYR